MDMATEFQHFLRDLFLAEQEVNEDSIINGAQVNTFDEVGIPLNTNAEKGLLVTFKDGTTVKILLEVE